ncbi:hypothetical protein AGMMS49991_06780 [Spirochaetia bacterium]|nr:hypothetical protein AGMMS49991_06780 [Spirochaetia bacterium]
MTEQEIFEFDGYEYTHLQDKEYNSQYVVMSLSDDEDYTALISREQYQINREAYIKSRPLAI